MVFVYAFNSVLNTYLLGVFQQISDETFMISLRRSLQERCLMDIDSRKIHLLAALVHFTRPLSTKVRRALKVFNTPRKRPNYCTFKPSANHGLTITNPSARRRAKPRHHRSTSDRSNRVRQTGRTTVV